MTIFDNGDVVDKAQGNDIGTSTMNPETRTLPRTFASIRFLGTDLSPERFTRVLNIEPTLAYAKGDVYVAGARRLQQFRRFGAWIFSTEHVLTGSLNEHCRFIAENCLMSHVDPAALVALLSSGDVGLSVALYWYGKSGAALPSVYPNFEKLINDRGGRLETVFDRDEEDEFRAA